MSPVRTAVRPCELGLAAVAVGDHGVRVLVLGDDESALRAEMTTLLRGDPSVEALDDDHDIAAVLEVVDGRSTDLPAVDLRGTAFQLDVWSALRQVPAGTTVTYGELAAAAGHPAAVRAVGTACGANPVAVVVPCHRVLPADGSLGGFRCGPDRKAALLRREGAAAAG
ncbi:MAG: methylated-DNA--[protein]-cysteine S-methyltransferase [Actinomycetes bacterium]